MKKIIITTGCDPREAWKEVLAISVPRFERYAARQGYDFKAIWYPDINLARFPEFRFPDTFTHGAVNPDSRANFIRWNLDRGMLAPNWLRYAAAIQLLDTYDLVVYFDGDCVIADFEHDLLADMPADRWLAAPICGPSSDNAGPGGPLWATRSCDESKAFWDRVWHGRKWITHPEWTDGVDFMDLLGYSIYPPVRKIRESEYDAAFYQISNRWATWGENPGDGGRCYHIAGGGAPEGKGAAMKALIARLGI